MPLVVCVPDLGFYTAIHDHCRSLLMAPKRRLSSPTSSTNQPCCEARPAYSASGRSEGRSIRQYWWSRGSSPVVGDTVEHTHFQGCFLILQFWYAAKLLRNLGYVSRGQKFHNRVSHQICSIFLCSHHRFPLGLANCSPGIILPV